MIEQALKKNDYSAVVLGLANLVLLARNRPGSRLCVDRILNQYLQRIDFREVPEVYRYRLLKELFNIYYEWGNWPKAFSYLSRMKLIDKELSIFTPTDDWIPGLIRWREGHLLWILNRSKTQLLSSISIAEEGLGYLQANMNNNSNPAGYCSSLMNTGWLHFLNNNPICIDYFELAIKTLSGNSPRSEIESKVGYYIACLRFKRGSRLDAFAQLKLLFNELHYHNLPLRNYLFLANEPEWIELSKYLNIIG